jgi:hypothetical protein
LLLAALSAVCNGFACLCLPALLGLPLAALTLWMASQDRHEINMGRMDPDGLPDAKAAEEYAMLSIVMGMISGGFPVLVFVLAGMK